MTTLVGWSPMFVGSFPMLVAWCPNGIVSVLAAWAAASQTGSWSYPILLADILIFCYLPHHIRWSHTHACRFISHSCCISYLIHDCILLDIVLSSVSVVNIISSFSTLKPSLFNKSPFCLAKPHHLSIENPHLQRLQPFGGEIRTKANSLRVKAEFIQQKIGVCQQKQRISSKKMRDMWTQP